jgi:phosphoglycolate phosphatase
VPPAGRQAVAWDLDGTLLDSRSSIRDTMNRVLAERGRPGFSADELRGLIGHGLRSILSKREPDRAAVEAMAVRYRDLYVESGWMTARVHDGLEELMRDLRRAGRKQAIVTSKGQQEAESVMASLGLLPLLDAVVGDDDVRPIKPDPAPVAEACRRMGVAPEGCAMVGDTRFDILAGLGAGCRTVGVLWGTDGRAELQQAGADAVVGDAKELRRALHL